MALTAYAFPDQITQCLDAGMDGHVAKPVDFTTFIDAVAGAIAGKPACWPDEFIGPVAAADTEQAVPVLDHTMLDATLATEPATDIVNTLVALRIRLEQMVRLLDQPADPDLLTDVARALSAAAATFGLVTLAKISRSFTRAVSQNEPASERIAQQLRAETCIGLAALDGLLRDSGLPQAKTFGIGCGVIVVENDPLVRGITQAIFQYAKQQVFLAADGLEAVILARQFKARLVLLDVDMPRLNGLLACEAIRALPGYAEVPIVVLTGFNDERIRHTAQRLGVTDFIVKPFRPDQLLARLVNHLDMPAAPLRGVFVDVGTPADPDEIGSRDGAGEALRGGWILPQAAGSDAPHGSLRGLRYNQEEVLLHAGVPPDLVQKWFGYVSSRRAMSVPLRPAGNDG